MRAVVVLLAAGLLASGVACSGANSGKPTVRPPVATTAATLVATASLTVAPAITPRPSSPAAPPTASPSPTPDPARAQPIGPTCPVQQPVKVTADKQAYPPENPDYDTAVPVVCFASPGEALKAGYHAAAVPEVTAAVATAVAPTVPVATLAHPTTSPAPAAATAFATATVVSQPAPAPVQPSTGGLTRCRDGTYSQSTGRGTCSHHGGIAR